MKIINILPQLIWVAFTAISIGMDASRHGEERPHKVNVWAVIVEMVINAALLYWGGFFNAFFVAE